MLKIGVSVVLESIEEAKISAQEEGTDYLGRNARACDACGSNEDLDALKMCSLCKVVFYCSVECQKADWRGHKHACKINSDCRKDQKRLEELVLEKSFRESMGRFESRKMN
jgi:hypothetical protein